MIMYADPKHMVYESKKHGSSNQLFNAIEQRISLLNKDVKNKKKRLIVTTSKEVDPEKFFTTIVPHITLVNFDFDSKYHNQVYNLLNDYNTEKFIYDKYYEFKQYLEINNIKFTHEQEKYEILGNKFFGKIYIPKIDNKTLTNQQYEELNNKLLKFKLDVFEYFIKNIQNVKELKKINPIKENNLENYKYNDWNMIHYEQIKFHFSILSTSNLSNLYNIKSKNLNETEKKFLSLSEHISKNRINDAINSFLDLTKPTEKKGPVPYPDNLIFEDTLSISLKKIGEKKSVSIFYPNFYELKENYFILRGKIYFILKLKSKN